MAYTINDKRGEDNNSERLSDAEVMDVVSYACFETRLPVPKTVLMQQGISEAQIERLFYDGRLKRVPVIDNAGTQMYHYYPASFEAYRADRTPPEPNDAEEPDMKDTLW